MQTEIVPLGTGAAIPSRERHLAALALRCEGDVLLFDCGEGTQRRLLEAGIKPSQIRTVLITHLHGNHFFGLPGLLSTLSLNGREEALTIVSPRPLKQVLRSIPGLDEGSLSFDLRFIVAKGDRMERVLSTAEYSVSAHCIEHRIPAVGYRFEESRRAGTLDVEEARRRGVIDVTAFRALKEGKSVVLPGGGFLHADEVVGPSRPGASFAYITDTRPCEGAVELARDATLVYHESTFEEQHAARAEETGHSTARQAAEIAEAAGAKKLLLGHISARYTDTGTLLREARAVFQNTEVAEELKRYSLREAPPAGDHQAGRDGSLQEKGGKIGGS